MANQVLYGFVNLKDLANERITPQNVEVVARAVQASVDEHNRQLSALIGLFAERTTQYKVRYQSPVAARLQPLDENGRARPIKVAGFYDVAFPIQAGGAAWGADRVTRAKMTVSEVERITATMLDADARWVRDHLLAALFASGTWTFSDALYGDLTVQPLANGDKVTYIITNGADAGATDTHQLAQAGAIADGANPYPTIYSELTEHPENGGEVICLIPTNLRATTEALTAFRPITDPNVREGANTAVLTGSLGAAVPGTVIGYVSKCWIVEWKSLPDNYIVGVTTDGEKPLALREEPEAELQGFKFVATRADHPFEEAHWERRAGFGAWNRVGALVYRIGNGSYAVPTNYGVPMP